MTCDMFILIIVSSVFGQQDYSFIQRDNQQHYVATDSRGLLELRSVAVLEVS